jgi:peptide/nickel transport system ATP-binding protein
MFTIPACHLTVPPPYEVAPEHHARCIRLDAVAAAKAVPTPALPQGGREENTA